jgi:hypothetical protein
MFVTFSRSLDIIKKSFGILLSEKKLLLFPLFSGIVLVILFALILVPTVFIPNNVIVGMMIIALVFLDYLASYFAVIFFNSALVHATRTKIENKSVSLM